MPSVKKLVVKTSFVTLGVCLILLLSLFGVLSLCVPYEMAEFTNSLGLETLSGDYAYQEYERSGDIEYLARSFEVAAVHGGARKAETRFEVLIKHEKFEELCASRDAQMSSDGSYKYRNYIYGYGACVKYRLAETENDKRKVCKFAIAETEEEFLPLNPVRQLAVEAVMKKDSVFCKLFLEEIDAAEKTFRENEDYTSIRKYLEECAK